MHRSRLSVLVVVASAAACSKRDDPRGGRTLSQDSTLVTRLESDQKARQLPFPDACDTIAATAVAAQPDAASKRQAEDLSRRGYRAEVLGNLQEAKSLLRKASVLDGTDGAAAYHLGRTSEALGDRSDAITAYCRYLVLAPTTAESVEARQRLAELLSGNTGVASGSVSDSGRTRRRAPSPTIGRRITRQRSTAAPRAVATTTVERPAAVTAPERGTQSTNVVAAGSVDLPGANNPAPTSPDGDGRADRVAAGDDGVPVARPVPVVEPSTAPRAEGRSTSRMQGAGIGAVAGAILGTAAGRSVKSAAIGAAAGGLLGAVVGRGTRPVIRGIRP